MFILCFLNLAGIANVTVVLEGGSVAVHDTGTRMTLLGLGVGKPFEEGGAIAEAGNPVEAAVEIALSHPYFSRPPPTSTGREVSNSAFLGGAALDQLQCG